MVSPQGGAANVAEQVCIERPPALVTEVLARPARTWIQPCMLLAWNEGRLALRRRGRIGPDDPSPTHILRIGPPDLGDRGTVAFGLRWTVKGVSLPFDRLDGRLTVSPIPTAAEHRAAALALFGVYSGAAAPEDWATAQTPAELVVRCLLGRLRAAIAAGGDTDPIAADMH